MDEDYWWLAVRKVVKQSTSCLVSESPRRLMMTTWLHRRIALVVFCWSGNWRFELITRRCRKFRFSEGFRNISTQPERAWPHWADVTCPRVIVAGGDGRKGKKMSLDLFYTGWDHLPVQCSRLRRTYPLSVVTVDCTDCKGSRCTCYMLLDKLYRTVLLLSSWMLCELHHWCAFRLKCILLNSHETLSGGANIVIFPWEAQLDEPM
jgi:hypothetical protein